jgi:hypothetical protein
VYLGVVTLANAKILTSTSNFTGWNFFFKISQTLAFVVFFLILSVIRSYDPLYGVFPRIFVHLLTYFALFFVSSALVIVDNGLHLVQHEISVIMENRDEERQKQIDIERANDHAVQKRRITDIKYRGFAFSQEAG